jgi:hypothetical protein
MRKRVTDSLSQIKTQHKHEVSVSRAHGVTVSAVQGHEHLEPYQFQQAYSVAFRVDLSIITFK